ncbi:P-loop containing nucleoside triphosphate hydrolases superfamily protein, partial [Fagus crenata]
MSSPVSILSAVRPTLPYYYLSSKSTEQAKRLKANAGKNSQSLVLTMDEHEEVLDEYEGVKLYWVFIKSVSKSKSISFYPIVNEK